MPIFATLARGDQGIMARIVDLFDTQASQKTKCALESKSSVNNIQYKVLKTSDQLFPKEGDSGD